MAKKTAKCKLLPFKKIDCLSIQEAKQQAGWAVTAFNLPKAWEYTQGEGVTIAVLDSGCDLTHPDLVENLLPGKNFVNPGKPPIDKKCCHGTHVTGILVASNNDIGIVGVCPKSKVMPVKVLDDNGNGNMYNVAEGIRWAADNGADLITMSLGIPIKIQEVRKAIQYAASKKVVAFCAAGNAGKTKELFYPSNYPETVSIGAITKDMKRADFSNTGQNLDFMAPGVDVLSTVPVNWYAIMQGTSMACPFAVGVAALVLSYVKKGKANFKLECADDYRNVFKKYTTKITGDKFYEGFGIIDPRKMIEEIK